MPPRDDSSKGPAQRAYDEAKVAEREGQLAEAGEKYEYFFDHALEERPSLYGVRLSFCLAAWARVAEKFPPAHERLVEKKNQTWRLLLETGATPLLHDFVALCRYLGLRAEPVARFRDLDATRPELALAGVGFVWDEFVAEGAWDLCAKYIGDPMVRLQTDLQLFDLTFGRTGPDPEMRASTDAHARSTITGTIASLVMVLRHAGRSVEAEVLLGRARDELTRRGHAALLDEIVERTAQSD